MLFGLNNLYRELKDSTMVSTFHLPGTIDVHNYLDNNDKNKILTDIPD
jgi:hypothetical protein